MCSSVPGTYFGGPSFSTVPRHSGPCETFDRFFEYYYCSTSIDYAKSALGTALFLYQHES